jgi:hypothetical protein
MLTLSLIALAYCRFIGIIFFIIIPIAFLLSKNRRTTLTYYIISCLFYVIFVGFTLSRNYYISGFLGGLKREAARKAFLDNLSNLWDTLQIQFLFSIEMLWGTILIVMVAVVIKYYARLKLSVRKPRYNTHRKNIIIISIVGLISYLGTLLILRGISQFDFIDTRLISPIWPFVIILLTVAFSNAWDCRFKYCGVVYFACSVIFIFPILNQNYAVYKRAAIKFNENNYTKGFYRNSKETFGNLSELQKWIFGHKNKYNIEKIAHDLKDIKGVDLLITESPQKFQFLTGIRSREFPSGNITDDTIKLINSSNERGYILVKSQPAIHSLNSYYKYEVKKLNLNKHFLKKHNALVIPLPLPIKQ